MGLPDPFDVTQLADELADRYRFERELGRGGSASVWLAHDLRHDRLVALKVLRLELCVAIGRERFLHEIRLTARLQHPHILPLLDSGEAAGRLWYTMPYVEGESLRQRLARERQLPIAAALAITRQVAGALASAHAHGVLHRDIKPDNILLSEGSAQVADFGIARLVDASVDDRLTGTGLAIGTPLYMSPEQVLGGRDVDHRTDQYALACTAYEMLAGEPPFTGGTAHSLIARRLAERAPSVRDARPEVPEPVAAALDRALDREPANRYATIAEFAGAFDSPAAASATPLPSPRLEQRRRFMWPAVAGTLLLAALVVWAWRPSDRTAVLDADLVAILPFDVLDPSLSQWHEGMADVLARYLDGAGPLRTVPAATVLRQSPKRSNRASADALGRSLGANVVVFGDLAPLSRDSVRLRATVVSLQEGRGDDIEVRGLSERMGQLADSLGRATLLALGRYRPINAVVGSTLGDAPLPVLKAFLRGERLYRSGHYDSALVEYQHALQLDSTFALANMRMVMALWYGRDTTGAYQTLDYYAARALGSLSRLSPRDSLLIVATACISEVQADTSRPLGKYGLYQCARKAAQQSVARYPTDPESWYLLGEAIMHMGGAAVGELDTSRSFERAIALDSFFTPAFDHVIWQAAGSGHVDRAARYATLAAVRSRGTPLATRYALEAATLAPVGTSPGYLDSLIRVATLRDLWDVAFDLRDATDSSEASLRMGQTLHERHVIPPGGVQRPGIFEDDSVQLRWVYANMLATRGHLRKAAELVQRDGPGGLWNPYLALALLGAIPAARVDSMMMRAPGPPEAAYPWRRLRMWSRIIEWGRMRRDTAQLHQVIGRLEVLANATGAAGPLNRYEAQAVVARAYLTLVRGDTASALRQLAAIPDSVCIRSVDCASPGLVQAGILSARGRDAEAARLFDRWIPAADGPLKIVLTLERARVAERMGDRATARDAYQRVLDTWRHADPELDPYVAEARAGVARLLSEPLDSM